MNRIILFILFFSLISGYASAAWLNQVELQVTQPDGTELTIYATGDEYYHWLHDKKGYTIVLDTDGYYRYATKENQLLVASPYEVGKVSPETTDLAPGLKISTSDYKQKVALFSQPVKDFRAKKLMMKSASLENIHTGNLNNITVFITFKNGSAFTETTAHYDAILNTDSISMYTYYKEVSYDQLYFSSHFYPTNSNADSILTYTDVNERDFYRPYNETTNTSGYKSDSELTFRLQTLLKNALESVKNEIPTDLIIDKDGDGYIDNLSFVVQGKPDGWGDLIWPHNSTLYQYNVQVNGVKAGMYTFQMEHTDVQTFCHEMFHMLGAPDLYHYEEDQSYLSPVGNWDLMESGFGHMGAWMKYRYADSLWIKEIPEIKQSGRYNLRALSKSDNNCFKIKPRSQFNTDEFFILEYRKKEAGSYENNLDGSGLLVYRINPNYEGNADGPPDEIYIYRPGGTSKVDGDIKKAYLADIDGYAVSDNVGLQAFLSDGTPSGLKISDISGAGDSISFYVETDRSDKANIQTFYMGSLMDSVVIDSINNTIKISVERETDYLNIKPFLTLSTFATSVPASAERIHLNWPEKTLEPDTTFAAYTVTAEDGTIKEWNIITTVMPNHKAKIISFGFVGLETQSYIQTQNQTVTVKVPYGTGLTNLIPTAQISVGGSISPDTLITTDFTNPLTYTVSSEDGTLTQNWTINVTRDEVYSGYNLEDLVNIQNKNGSIYIESFQQDLNYAVYTLNGSAIQLGNLNGQVTVEVPGQQGIYIVQVYNKLGNIVRKIRLNIN